MTATIATPSTIPAGPDGSAVGFAEMSMLGQYRSMPPASNYLHDEVPSIPMEPLVIALPGNEELAGRLAIRLGVEVGRSTFRRFPDGEEQVRLPKVTGREVVIVGTMQPPSERALQILFAAATARDLGAARIGLVAPYLGYMRQDFRFHTGDGLTSIYFASMVSARYDWLVTVDPHLHRIRSLDKIYTIPTRVVAAAPDIATWIAGHVENGVLIGPDAESEQWVGAVAKVARLPHLILEKRRLGDHEVQIKGLDPAVCEGRVPVIIDDIISTGGTMMETIKLLAAAGIESPLCIGTHAVFAGSAQADLLACGAQSVVTCNTIPHGSNGIDVLGRMSEIVASMVDADV